MSWWMKSFQVERVCTCKSRSLECNQRGWHVVDSHDDEGAARDDAAALAASMAVAYRVVSRHTGAPV